MKNILLAALCAASFLAARADTVAWWHFDEADPGTVATEDIAASDTAASLSATPVSLTDATAAARAGDWLPSYARPFQGLAVYDPVTDTTRTNRSAMRFRTAESGKYGGALHALTESSDVYRSTANAITVEAFVCTTGGVFSTFAPIVACMEYENWTNEKWAIYEEADGTISLRFGGSPFWSGNSGQAGTAKINDGAWHHVAFTWDGSTVKVFVDYDQDKFKSSGNPRQFSKSTTLNYNNGGQWDYTRIGGYKGKSGEVTARRRFNGLVDEVRVSNAALTPDRFLRLQPLDMDEDEVLRVSFEPGEYGAVKADANLADALGPNRQKALYKIRNAGGSAAFDAASKPSDAIAPAFFADGVANAASFSFATNGTGADSGCYVQAPSLSSRLVGGSATNFTIECFFRTRGQVRGATSNRQTVFKLGSGIVLGQATLSQDTGNGNGMERGDLLLVYRDKANGNNHYDGSFDTDLDDGAWHHIAFVIDGDHRQERTYVDGRLSHRRTNFDLGVTADVVSLFVGCGYEGNPGWKPIQFFDGWIDGLRVTKRALAPEEFLSAHPFGAIGDGPQPLLLAPFNGDHNLVCASNAAFSVTGTGEARMDGNAPAFVNSTFGALLLDGANGSVKARSVQDISMNRSRVVFPTSPLYELDAFTVEFWAKFTDILTATGSVGRAEILPNNHNLGILRCTQGDTSDFDWYLYRGYWAGNDVSLAVRTGLAGGSVTYQDFTLGRNLVDGRWHHYALSFEPSADTTKTLVSLYDDYELVETKEIPAAYETRAGRVLKLFEGSTDHPNLVGLVNSFRLSRGVLAPSQFLGRDRSGIPFVLIVR